MNGGQWREFQDNSSCDFDCSQFIYKTILAKCIPKNYINFETKQVFF